MSVEVEPSAQQFSDKGEESSATVSVSSDESQERREQRWDRLKKRYQAAKYSSAKLKSALKTSTRTSGRGRYFSFA